MTTRHASHQRPPGPTRPPVAAPAAGSASSVTPAFWPERLRPAVPPGLRHGRTERGVTRRSRVISSTASPRGEPLSRLKPQRSHRCCPAGAYRPRCAYRMPRSYPAGQPTSSPDLYELNLVNSASGHGRSASAGRLAWPHPWPGHRFHPHASRRVQVQGRSQATAGLSAVTHRATLSHVIVMCGGKLEMNNQGPILRMALILLTLRTQITRVPGARSGSHLRLPDHRDPSSRKRA